MSYVPRRRVAASSPKCDECGCPTDPHHAFQIQEWTTRQNEAEIEERFLFCSEECVGTYFLNKAGGVEGGVPMDLICPACTERVRRSMGEEE